jgi:hypothetical protein
MLVSALFLPEPVKFTDHFAAVFIAFTVEAEKPFCPFSVIVGKTVHIEIVLRG